MNAIFTNTYTSSKKYFKEIYASIFLGPFTIVLMVFSWLTFFANLALLILGQEYFTIGFLVAPWFTLIILYIYFSQVRGAVKREKEMYGSFTTITSTVTDEYIDCQSSSGNSSRLEYGNIAGIKKTKNLILIRSKARFIFVMERSTFVGGTDEDFIRYLKGKMAKS